MTQNTQAVEAEREKFEAWAETLGIDCTPWISTEPQAGYNNGRTSDYWHGWLARAELARPLEVAAPVGDALIAKVRQDWNYAQPEHNRWENLTERSRLLLVAKAASRVPVASVAGVEPLSAAVQKLVDDFAFEAGKSAIAVLEGVDSRTPEGVIIKQGFNRAHDALIAAISPTPAPGGAGGDVGAAGLSLQNWRKGVDQGPVPVLYTDLINDEFTHRDDLWLATTGQLAAAQPPKQDAAPVAVEAVPKLSAIEDCLNEALVSWHEINGRPSEPSVIESLAHYLTVCMVEDANVPLAATPAPVQPTPAQDAAPAVAIEIGSIVRFEGETFKVVCNGDIPGTFDLHVHPRGRAGDQWRNVPASALAAAIIASKGGAA